MENKNSYKIVGVFFVVCIFCISAFLFLMNEKGNKGGNYKSYYIQTQILPNGIKEGSEVRFIGVNVGFVKKIYFSDLQNATIEIEIFINEGLPIKKDSVAVVESKGITGISYINITKGSNLAKNFNKNEKAIISLKPNFIDKISSNTEMLSKNLNDALQNLSSFLNENNAKKINSILNNLNKTILYISTKENMDKINSIINSLDNIVNKFENESLAMNDFFTKASKTLDRIDKFIDNADQTLSLMQSDDYNLRAITFPALNQTTNTMNEFQNVLKEIKSMLFRLEDDPYKFFFKNNKKEN